MITFIGALNDMIAQFLPQLIKIHYPPKFARLIRGFGHAARKQIADLRDVLVRQVRAMHF